MTEGYKNNKRHQVWCWEWWLNQRSATVLEKKHLIIPNKSSAQKHQNKEGGYFKRSSNCSSVVLKYFKGCSDSRIRTPNLPLDRVKQTGFFDINNIKTILSPLFTFHQQLQINSGYQSLDRTVMCIFRNHFFPRSPKPADMENKWSKYFLCHYLRVLKYRYSQFKPLI